MSQGRYDLTLNIDGTSKSLDVEDYDLNQTGGRRDLTRRTATVRIPLAINDKVVADLCISRPYVWWNNEKWIVSGSSTTGGLFGAMAVRLYATLELTGVSSE